jgi:hypothetical protein
LDRIKAANYGQDFPDYFSKAAGCADKILRGAKPRTCTVEHSHPSKSPASVLFGTAGACAEAEPPMRFVAPDCPSNDLTLGKMALVEISAMDSFEALAIVVVFVLTAVAVTTLVQTRRR